MNLIIKILSNYRNIIKNYNSRIHDYFLFWYWLYIVIFILSMGYIIILYPKSLLLIYQYLTGNKNNILTILVISYPVIYFLIRRQLKNYKFFHKISKDIIFMLYIVQLISTSFILAVLTFSYKTLYMFSMKSFNYKIYIMLSIIIRSACFLFVFEFISIGVILIICTLFWLYFFVSKKIMPKIKPTLIAIGYFISGFVLSFIIIMIDFSLIIQFLPHDLYNFAFRSQVFGYIFLVISFIIDVVFSLIIYEINRFLVCRRINKYKSFNKREKLQKRYKHARCIKIIFWVLGSFSNVIFVFIEGS